MAEYRIRETGEIVLDLASAFPNTSIPATPSLEDLDALGVDAVMEGAQPEHTQFQIVFRDGVEQVEGIWFTKYAVADMDQDAIDAMTAAQWASVRQKRNQMLADCDWTQLPDCPLTNVQQTEWASRRQYLRDITTQSDPWNIDWGKEPE